MAEFSFKPYYLANRLFLKLRLLSVPFPVLMVFLVVLRLKAPAD